MAAEPHYRDFIDEAFIRPIRSVLIVDDDYPTIDSVLEQQVQRVTGSPVEVTGQWERKPERIKAMLRRLRAHSPALLIDFHDGAPNSAPDNTARSERLRQSDLLVLDYQLEGSGIGSGEEAIRILRQLLQSRHFNMVIVYSQEDAEDVFRKVLLTMLGPVGTPLHDFGRRRAKELLVDADDTHEGLGRKFRQSIGTEQYLYSRRHSSNYAVQMARGLPPFSDLANALSLVSWTERDQRLVARHLLEEYAAKRFPDQPTTRRARAISWGERNPRWIKADALFVTFVRKTNDDDLLGALRDALHDWSPDPSRLFGAKTRAEMEALGITAQDEVVEERPAFAYWYDELVRTEDDEERHWRVEESVGRQTERLMDVVLPEVEDFGRRLLKEEREQGNLEDLCVRRFEEDIRDVDVRRDALAAHNTFVCSKKPTGWHLRTGHVFTMGQEHWLCVSPACDLVPSQMSKWQKDAFDKCLPFIGIKLRGTQVGRALGSVNTNRYIFLRSGPEVEAFCFNTQADSAPEWHLLYAEDRGRLTEGKELVVSQTQRGPDGLLHARHKALIVGQLRYEYALNLAQKLGGALTRIGLEFVGVEPE